MEIGFFGGMEVRGDGGTRLDLTMKEGVQAILVPPYPRTPKNRTPYPRKRALFVLNLFYAWFSNTEPSSIQKTLRNTAGTYTIEIDANIIDHLPQLEEKVLGKNHQ